MEWFLKMFRLVFIKGHGGLENKRYVVNVCMEHLIFLFQNTKQL